MPVLADSSLLGEIGLFRGLTLVELSRLTTLLHRRTFPVGATFITAEQPGEAVYIIAEGAVKVSIDDADGNEVILAILAAGEIVGEMSLLDSTSRSANVVTLEETTVYWIDRVSFGEILRTMPEVHFNLSRLLCARMRLANARIQSLALQDVEGRVARQLLAFAEIYGKESADGSVLIPFRLTQTDLASLIGATRVRVNQVIATYKHRNYLSVDSNYRITIHAYERLQRRSRGATKESYAQEAARQSKTRCSLFYSAEVTN